jgi:CelD/BcsL family acetyltransferase involved in cellulose biosynthesis
MTIAASDGAVLSGLAPSSADPAPLDNRRDTTTVLFVERVSTEAALAALAPEWNHLHSTAASGLPFTTHAWATAWWRHLRAKSAACRDSLDVRVVRDGSGRLVAIAPLMRTERPAHGPIKFRIVQFLGTDPNLTELRTVIAEPADEAVAVHALWDSLKGSNWDWLIWNGARQGTPAAALTATWPGLAAIRDVENFRLQLPDSWETFRSTLKNNIKNSIRHCYNSLARDGHSFELDIAKGSCIPEALKHFFVLHRLRAQTDTAVRHPDYFATEAARNFLIDVCRELPTRIFRLRVNGDIVAARIGFEFGDHLYLYYSGYSPDWGGYSVMTTTLVETLKYAIGRGVKTVNLSTGRDVSKTRWGPSETTFRESTFVASSARGRLAYRSYNSIIQTADHPLVRRALRRSWQ